MTGEKEEEVAEMAQTAEGISMKFYGKEQLPAEPIKSGDFPLKAISLTSEAGRRWTGGRTGRKIYTGNRSGINEHRLRIRDRRTVYQSPFPKTGILEKRSNNPNRPSVRPRRYERKRSSGLLAEYEDRRIRRNGHGV